MKLAMWLVYKYIRDNNLRDKVHIILQVHDQLVTLANPAEASWPAEWALKLDQIMCQAAKTVITTGLLKADTNVTDVWSK